MDMVFYTKTQEPYSQLLEKREWKLKRDHILRRDGFRCAHCGKSGGEVELHVHHRHYVFGRDPWEYNDPELITLCMDCHNAFHAQNRVPMLVEKDGQFLSVTREPCFRCNGTGYFPEYRHILNGVCFRCWGQRFEECISVVEDYAEKHDVTVEELFDGFEPLTPTVLGRLINDDVRTLEASYYPSKEHSPNIMLITHCGRIEYAFADYSMDFAGSAAIPLNPNTLKYRIGTSRDGSNYLIVKGTPMDASMAPRDEFLPLNDETLSRLLRRSCNINHVEIGENVDNPGLLTVKVILKTGEIVYAHPAPSLRVSMGDRLSLDSLSYKSFASPDGSRALIVSGIKE